MTHKTFLPATNRVEGRKRSIGFRVTALVVLFIIAGGGLPLEARRARHGATVEVVLVDGGRVRGELLAVTRVQGKYTFETELAAAAAAVKVGTKIQVASGGLKAKYVTGASDAAVPGTFEVVSLEGTAAGSMIRGRFV